MITDLQNAKNNWIYQSNKLIEASYTLTVVEQKLIRLLASMIKKDDDEFKEYEFETKNLIKVLNTSDSRFYRDIDNITDLLMQRIIKIKDIDTGDFEKYHWVDVCKYKSGTLKLQINKELKPFYLSLDWYTKYQLKNIMQFKCTYSFRMYELLKQYENIGSRTISIDDLRFILDINKNQYQKYANLKQKVIKKSISEINTKTDLYIEYEELKKVRKVVSIKFIIHSNNKSKCQIAADTTVKSIESQKQQNNNIDKIKIVKSIIKEDISDNSAKSIFDAARGDVEKIKEKYVIISNLKQVDNVVGAMIQAIKEDWTSISKRKVSMFNNFKQRTYDYDELEKKLLGWDKEEE